MKKYYVYVSNEEGDYVWASNEADAIKASSYHNYEGEVFAIPATGENAE